jgi:hypothetical protein
MKSMTINDYEVTFTGRPKHKAVVAARSIMTEETLKILDITDIDPTKPMADYIKDKMTEDPAVMEKLTAISADLPVDQTIILATGLTYATLQELKEDIYADDFIELYEKSMKALGGKTAEDFFAIYPTSMNFRNNPAMRL